MTVPRVPEARAGRLSELVRRACPLRPHALALVGTAVLASVTTREILSVAGGPAVPLDDAYIHFQYARSLAELHPFRYTAGADPTPGATSLLWPLVLSPFHALGFRGELLVWPAWGIGWTTLALLAVETARLAAGLVRPLVAVAAGAMVLAFGGFTWFAASGMEVVPFAWLAVRTATRAAEWLERKEATGDAERRAYRELVLSALCCPLLRPEGALASLLVAAALIGRPFRHRRAWALPAIAAPLLPSLLCFVGTGQAALSTALAKWLPLNPYYPPTRLFWAVLGNVALFFETLLDGRLWSSVFLPAGGRWVAVAAIVALPVLGRLERRLPRALVVLALGLGILIPTTYETFLVNRVRYIWPFAAAWFVALAALAEVAGRAIERAWGGRRAGLEPVPVLCAGAFVGLLAARLPPSIEDVAQSAHAISLQQVSIARWAATSLPGGARIGVNDTGAVAYFSGRRTFDVVGLTTSGEARYWTAGAGSRFEHYEKLPRERLPTHFVVYPEWFALPQLLGEELTSRSVRHTILGGHTVVAALARYEALGSGEIPSGGHPAGAELIDTLDVADLESEAAHGYALVDATKETNAVFDDGGRTDGGRTSRTRDLFTLRIAPGGSVVVRCGAAAPGRLSLRAEGIEVASATLTAAPWQEVRLQLPGLATAAARAVEVTAGGAPFDSMHYWSYEHR